MMKKKNKCDDMFCDEKGICRECLYGYDKVGAEDIPLYPIQLSLFERGMEEYWHEKNHGM